MDNNNQGFTMISEGCFNCLPDFDDRGEPVRPQLKAIDGFWRCSRCGMFYGVVKKQKALATKLKKERNSL